MVKFREVRRNKCIVKCTVCRVRGPGTDRATKHNGIRMILGGVEGFVQDQQTILSGRHLCPRKQSQCFVRVQGGREWVRN
jgi:hypothetical protein